MIGTDGQKFPGLSVPSEGRWLISKAALVAAFSRPK
jgi:hypothetical protein